MKFPASTRSGILMSPAPWIVAMAKLSLFILNRDLSKAHEVEVVWEGCRACPRDFGLCADWRRLEGLEQLCGAATGCPAIVSAAGCQPEGRLDLKCRRVLTPSFNGRCRTG